MSCCYISEFALGTYVTGHMSFFPYNFCQTDLSAFVFFLLDIRFWIILSWLKQMQKNSKSIGKEQNCCSEIIFLKKKEKTLLFKYYTFALERFKAKASFGEGKSSLS